MNAHNRTLLTVICEAALEHKLVADLKNPWCARLDAIGRPR